MKHLIFTFLTILPLSLPAAPSLKIELIVPKEKVSLEKGSFAKANALVVVKKQLEALYESSKLTPALLKEAATLEQQVWAGQKLKQGLPLKLRFTNTSDKDFTFRYGGDTSTIFLTVKGPAAINLPHMGPMTDDYQMGKPTTIKAGATKDLTIEELRNGDRAMSRWLIGKPGKYTITLRFKADLEGKKIQLKAEEVTVVVE